MEKLEKFIRSNKSSFDGEEPLPGHFERFRQKMDARKPAKKVNLFMVAAAAAVTGLMLTGTLGILYNDPSLLNLSKKELSLGVSGEYKEVDNYYINQINRKNQLINDLTKKSTLGFDIETKRVLDDLDKSFFSLKQDLIRSPKQERIVNAMIEHYQIKNEMLDQIIDTLTKTDQY
jgi:hypothetical protein